MNIVGNKHLYFIISGLIIAVGVAFMIYNISAGKGAFNFNVDFTGGLEMSVDIGQSFNNDDIALIITESLGDVSPQIQRVLGTNTVNIKMHSIDSEQRTKLMDALKEKYGIDDSVFEVTDISASISDEMRQAAVMAVLAACAGILLYVSFRFRDLRMGGSAILALVHDTALVVLSYAVFRIPLNYSFIAAVLTILGFSINATIVIFDRIRENRRLLNRPSPEDLVNISVTQTSARCVYTSLTVLIVTICLYVFGVPAIKDFMLPIMVGVIGGTYSSIFLSGSLFYIFTVGFKKAFAKA